MLIKNLPKEIQKKAKEYCIPKYKTSIFNNSTGDLGNAFYWQKTPEGVSFWFKINMGNFNVFYDKYPKVVFFKKVYTLIYLIFTKHKK